MEEDIIGVEGGQSSRRQAHHVRKQRHGGHRAQRAQQQPDPSLLSSDSSDPGRHGGAALRAFFARQLMMPEWLTDVPPDLATTWCACAARGRCASRMWPLTGPHTTRLPLQQCGNASIVSVACKDVLMLPACICTPQACHASPRGASLPGGELRVSYADPPLSCHVCMQTDSHARWTPPHHQTSHPLPV